MSISASAPGKVNLGLWVGAPEPSGFHPLLTAFQAVDRWDTVRVSDAEQTSLQVEGSVDCSGVPEDSRNLAWRALELVADRCSIERSATIQISKNIPVAGGMAGGSADAAAALLAVNAAWDCGLDDAELAELAAELGSDVPFALHGMQAIGRVRGDALTPVETTHPLYVVVCPSAHSLHTGAVYAEYDRLHPHADLPADLPAGFLRAWVQGNAHALAPLLHNDLADAAYSLLPELRDTAAAIEDAGALRAMVSGSGPTMWGLAESAEHAQEVATALSAGGLEAWVTQSATTRPGLRPVH